MKNIHLGFLIVTLATSQCIAQQQAAPWNKKKCAVVLMYDDALDSHLDKVIPALDSFGFKGSFYLLASIPLKKRIDNWRAAALRGHELGNHSLFHPCAGKSKDREWVEPEGDLDNYTVVRMQTEILAMNALLYSIDGKTKRTYAAPCGDYMIQDSSYFEGIKNHFVAARDIMPDHVRFTSKTFSGNESNQHQLIALVKDAMQHNSIVFILFHGVGGDHAINVDTDIHYKLLQFIKKNEFDIWVPTYIEALEYIKLNHREKQ